MTILSALMNRLRRARMTARDTCSSLNAAVAENGQPESAIATAGSVVEVAATESLSRTKGLKADFKENEIEIGENIVALGEIRGSGNVIRIAKTRNVQRIHIRIYGNNNHITIGKRSLLQDLVVEIGSPRWRSSQTRLTIGDHFSVGSRSRFILPNSGNVIEIGDGCMLSKSVQLRGGEFPHMIFDSESGAYLDESDGIFIGDHVWIGEQVFIAKAVTIPRECIVGARSVVTKRFTEENSVIAGNPSRVVKRGVQWVATRFALDADHPTLAESFVKTRIHAINQAEDAVWMQSAKANTSDGKPAGTPDDLRAEA